MTDVMDQVDIQHHFGGGVYAKQATFRPGLILSQHIHSHDHLSILAYGSVVLQVDGVNQILTAEPMKPICLCIKAGKKHKVESLTEVVWFCIHATEETDPEKVDHVLIGE